MMRAARYRDMAFNICCNSNFSLLLDLSAFAKSLASTLAKQGLTAAGGDPRERGPEGKRTSMTRRKKKKKDKKQKKHKKGRGLDIFQGHSGIL